MTICRLNYIGSKFQLLDWLTGHIKEITGRTTFDKTTVADLFAGTGIVSHHFRTLGATVVSNDVESYSSIITRALTCSTWSDACKTALAQLQGEIDAGAYTDTVGFVTTHYSPYNGSERMFFTVDNAKRIDYLRIRLEALRTTLTPDEYAFILACIILAADAVSNVPAVYGCYLKNFKAKALKNLALKPVHTLDEDSKGSVVHNSDILDVTFLRSLKADIVYLDPPYNDRQYSKNYFPLNIIAKTPEQLVSEAPLKGKTGIPADCFISPFCKKSSVVVEAFDTLFRELRAEWIFVSYSSESTVDSDTMLATMKKYGNASVIERDYKRFKSFEYNKDTQVKEYLFCLHKSNSS
jgi:adenine-specific DNA-methyltransferase